MIKSDCCLSEDPHSAHSTHVEGEVIFYYKISVYILSSDVRSKSKDSVGFLFPSV